MNTRVSNVALTLIVIVVAMTVGWAMINAGAAVQEQQNEINDRGQEVYGEEYVTVSSDNCYDYCSATADSPSIRERSLLIAADRRQGWVSLFTLSEAVPGNSPEDTADRLVEKGLLEKRETGLLERKEYRYVGPEGKYEEGFTYGELEKRIKHQLYVSGSWMTLDEIMTSVPAARWRVEKALVTLDMKGVVKTGIESHSSLPIGGNTAYAHHTVENSPPSSNYGTFWATAVFIGLFLALATLSKRVPNWFGDEPSA